MKFKSGWWWITVQAFAIGCQLQGTAQARPPDQALTQHFVCNTGYTLEKCREELSVLRKVVAKYPTAMLGQWTWVLVRSQDWQAILRQLKLNPDSPAFSWLSKRDTFIEEALVAEAPGRRLEITMKWDIDGLLDLAVRHELGHALCNEINEAKAAEAVRMLQRRRIVSCEFRREAQGFSEEPRKTDEAADSQNSPR